MTTGGSGERVGARWILTPPSTEDGKTPEPVGSRTPIQRKTGPDGADIGNLSPKVTQTFPTIVDVFRNHKAPAPVITSGRDGKHKAGSRHYRDEAIDLRCNHLTADHCQRISDALQKALGSDYYLEFEKYDNEQKNHIHLEYDPKPKPRSDLGGELGIKDWMTRRNRATGLG